MLISKALSLEVPSLFHVTQHILISGKEYTVTHTCLADEKKAHFAYTDSSSKQGTQLSQKGVIGPL